VIHLGGCFITGFRPKTVKAYIRPNTQNAAKHIPVANLCMIKAQVDTKIILGVI
jgi:hypothetical protein